MEFLREFGWTVRSRVHLRWLTKAVDQRIQSEFRHPKHLHGKAGDWCILDIDASVAR